jgi:hypothetical protein
MLQKPLHVRVQRTRKLGEDLKKFILPKFRILITNIPIKRNPAAD